MRFRVIFKTILFLLVYAIISVTSATSQVIFQDNFNSSSDWQSQQTIHKSAGGTDISFSHTFRDRCTKFCPPDGWTSYRAPSSQWTDNRGQDTFLLDATGARGGKGKGITYNVESTDDYGLWAGGSLDIWLGETGYRELFVRMWLKFSNEWLYSTPERNEHGLQKLVRISVFNENIATTSYNPQAYGSVSVNWPVWYPDWYYNAAYGYGCFSSSVRKAPDYDASGDDTTHTDVRFSSASQNAAQGDNQWHCYEFRVKMNSAPGVADGEWELFLDGVSRKSRNTILWKKSGSNDRGWNWLMVLDNVSASPYSKAEHREMALYMDDLVVSTTYVGQDYIIPEATTEPPMNKTPSPPSGLQIQPYPVSKN